MTEQQRAGGKTTQFTPRLRRTTYLLALLFSVSVVTAAIFANLISYRHHRRWDLTRKQQFTLKPRTVLALKSIRKPIKVTTLFVPQTKRRPGEGALIRKLSDRVHELLALFGQHTDKLTVEKLDYIAHRTRFAALVARFKGVDLEDTVIFEQGDSRLFVKGWELARFDRRRMRITRWQAESVLTSAILRVTDQRKHKIYVYPGLRTLNRGLRVFKAMLTPENVSFHRLDTRRPAPDDCDLLLLAPAEDLRPAEARLLLRYLQRGGRLLLVLSPKTSLLPNLDMLLARFGVAGDYNLVMKRAVTLVIDQLSPTHPITAPIAGMQLELEFCMSFQQVPGSQAGLSYHSLMVTGKGPQWTDVRLGHGEQTPAARGPYVIGAAVSWPAPPRKNKIPIGRIAIFGSQSMLEDQLLERTNLGNRTVSHNAVQWLLDREGRIVEIISAPEPSGEVFLTEQQTRVLGFALIGLFPLTALFVGILVWLVRKD